MKGRLLWLSLLCVSAAAGDDCSREASRQARRIIEKYIEPIVGAFNYTWPRDCPLDPQGDKYLWQERHKTRTQEGHWHCGFCNKRFVNEGYLDRHLQLRHSGEFRPNASRCLADLCPLLHCDVLNQSGSRRVACHEATSRQQKMLCELVMHVCFPAAESSSAASLYSYTRRQLCEAHVCADLERERRFAELERRRRPVGLCDIYAMILILSVGLCLPLLRFRTRRRREV